MVPTKPRAASSKSLTSENGSVFSVDSCCATTEADASFGISLGISAAVWVILVTPRYISWVRCLAELDALKLAAAAPRIDIFEVGERTGGMADIELRCRARLVPFIVVITWRAGLRAGHPAGRRQQAVDPAIL